MKRVKKFFLRLRKLWELSALYDGNRRQDIAYIERLFNQVNDRIGEHTTVHADIHWKHQEAHQIIVIGEYHNRDYVRVFDLDTNNWSALVKELHRIEKNARVGRFDVPHLVPFSVVYERDRF